MNLKKYFSKLPLTLLISSILISIGCVSTISTNPLSTFDAHGPVAQSQLVLFYWILGAAIFVFIAMTIILVYTVYKFRRKPEDEISEQTSLDPTGYRKHKNNSLYPEQIHGNKKLEIAWTILPCIILAIIAVPTVITIFDNTNSPDTSNNSITVDVYAHQWFWEFKYDDPNNESEKITVANEMHIPVGKVVNINLYSGDVIHSFWIPKLAGKVDLMPGNNNKMWIQADKEGEYRGQCAEFCGVAHALMKFRVIAESQKNYEQWLLAQSTDAVESVSFHGAYSAFGHAHQQVETDNIASLKFAHTTNRPLICLYEQLIALKQASIICEIDSEQLEDIFWRNAVREFNVPWN